MSISTISPIMSIVEGRPVASSVDVAAHFGKQHHKVVASIRAIIRNAPESFATANFGGSEYTDSTGRSVPFFYLTRTGFSLLAMGFTGRKALKWKIAYVQAFDAMEAELLARAAQPLPSPAAKPKAVKADRLIKITRHVVAAEMRVGVKAVCKSMGREPGKGDYKAGYKHFRVACNFMRFEDCTDEKAAAGLPDLRRRFDEQLEGLERCEGCVKVTIPWRPISPDGKHVISRAKAQAALPAAPAESEQVALPRLTTGAERKPLAVAVNKMIGANDEGPTRQKYMHFWRTLNAALGIKSIEELTADRLPAVMNLLELLAGMITAPAVAPLPGSVPADFAALSPADQVNALLDAFEKTVDFAQNNTWAIETKLMEIVKRVDIGPGMDHMQGMQVRQMVNYLRIGFVHAMQPIQASLNAIRPLFWMLSAASKLGQRVGRALPAGPRLGGSLPA